MAKIGSLERGKEIENQDPAIESAYRSPEHEDLDPVTPAAQTKPPAPVKTVTPESDLSTSPFASPDMSSPLAEPLPATSPSQPVSSLPQHPPPPASQPPAPQSQVLFTTGFGQNENEDESEIQDNNVSHDIEISESGDEDRREVIKPKQQYVNAKVRRTEALRAMENIDKSSYEGNKALYKKKSEQYLNRMKTVFSKVATLQKALGLDPNFVFIHQDNFHKCGPGQSNMAGKDIVIGAGPMFEEYVHGNGLQYNSRTVYIVKSANDIKEQDPENIPFPSPPAGVPGAGDPAEGGADLAGPPVQAPQHLDGGAAQSAGQQRAGAGQQWGGAGQQRGGAGQQRGRGGPQRGRGGQQRGEVRKRHDNPSSSEQTSSSSGTDTSVDSEKSKSKSKTGSNLPLAVSAFEVARFEEQSSSTVDGGTRSFQKGSQTSMNNKEKSKKQQRKTKVPKIDRVSRLQEGGMDDIPIRI